MSVGQILRKKRDGEEITKNEIEFLIGSIVNGNVSESQIGALLMAMYIKGLSDSETIDLTRSMVNSGALLMAMYIKGLSDSETIDLTRSMVNSGALLMAMYIKGLSDSETIDLTRSMVNSGDQLHWRDEWAGMLVDKHSTGGVGDKISLVLAPVLAACGLKVPMISGRSLEHTGGTLDKLESIPGCNVELDAKTMQRALDEVGCFISAATSQICPADRILYRIRDITSTVDYKNLIVASITSKKVASGTKFLVMDLKVGKAAFCKTMEDARSLAKQLISVSGELGVRTRVVISRMDAPLGLTAGNALEVTEAVRCLTGRMSPDMAQLVSALGCNLLEMTNYQGDPKQLINQVIADGSALKRFCKMLAVQGVSEETIQGLVSGKPVLPTAKYTTQFKVHSSGWVTAVDGWVLGQVCLVLGAGRVDAGRAVDPCVGVQLHCQVGDSVQAGQTWLTVHHSSHSLPTHIMMCLQPAITVEPARLAAMDVVIEVIH